MSVKLSESTDEPVVAILDPLHTTTSSISRRSTLCSCSLKCVYATIPTAAAMQCLSKNTTSFTIQW